MRIRLFAQLIVSLLLVAIAAVAAPAASAETITVNATDDQSGPCTTTHCSLREAITFANTLPGADTITFSLPLNATPICLPLGGCVTFFSTDPIVVSTKLPDIVDPVTIDGSTQPHFVGPPMVEVRAASSLLREGLVLGAGSDNSRIRSLSITGFGTGAGIVVASSNNLVAASRIGVDMNGNARANNEGIVIEGDHNQIGGNTGTGDGNVISGNTDTGVLLCFSCFLNTHLDGTDASGNLLLGNLIGTNPGGTAAMPNGTGVNVLGRGFSTQFNIYLPGVGGNDIGGGSTSAFRNVISGNRQNGVAISGALANTMGGNYIGLNAAGTAAVPNGAAGLLIDDAPGTLVGDFPTITTTCTLLGHQFQCPFVSPGPNVISGNASDGIQFKSTSNTHDVAIVGNMIGTEPTGTTGIGNAGNGISVTGLMGLNNVVGRNTAADSNVIAFNANDGVRVSLTASAGVLPIRFNSIFSNGGRGIDSGGVLGGGAPTFISIVSDSTTNTTTLKGSVDPAAFFGNQSSAPLDLYQNASCDASGFGEGQTYVQTVSVSSSSPSFVITLGHAMNVGTIITATTTSGFGATSEFSHCATVTSNGQTGTFVLTPHAATVDVGQPVIASVTWTVPSPRVWRNLATIDLRLSVDQDQQAMQIHWDQSSQTFSLAGRDAAFAAGSPHRLETEWGYVDLSQASVVGSGPTGQSVTLKLPIVFKQHAAGRTFTVAVAASDNLGDADPFLGTATWHVAD